MDSLRKWIGRLLLHDRISRRKDRLVEKLNDCSRRAGVRGAHAGVAEDHCSGRVTKMGHVSGCDVSSYERP